MKAILLAGLVLLLLVAGCRETKVSPTPDQPPSLPLLSKLGLVYPYGISLGPPALVDSENFEMELFADLTGFPRNWTFELTFTGGENGFPEGLYITGGPSFGNDKELRRLFRVEKSGMVSVVEDGFEKGVESLVFARGDYGDGMLITEPQSLRVNRLLSGGTLTPFASLGTEPFGPSQLAYGPDGLLYVTDYTGGNILRVHPDGSSEILASVPPTVALSCVGACEKALLLNSSDRFRGDFFTATFSVNFRNAVPPNLDSVYSVSIEDGSVSPLAGGFNGIEFLALGPGGDFGSDLYVAAHGTDLNGDGGVYTVAPDGTTAPFMTGIDAMHVAFDTEGILGGGMFVADLNNPWGAPEFPVSRIWRVVPR